MKRIGFRADHVDPIVAGEKTLTVRYDFERAVDEGDLIDLRTTTGDVDDGRDGTGEAIVANGPVDLDVQQAADILGVSPDSPDRVIKTAYQEQTKTAHPDVGGSSAEFQRVTEAKEVLLSDE